MKRFMLLGQKEHETVGATVFKTGSRGWMGLGLRTVETWDPYVLEEWVVMNPGKGEREYLIYMRKFNKKHQMTPGVAAGTALMLAGHQGFVLPGRSFSITRTGDIFMDDLGMLADCVGPMISALRSSFKTWCQQKERLPDLESFDVFMGSMEPDLPVANKMLGLLARILATLGIRPVSPKPVQPFNQLGFGDEFSNLSGFSFLSNP